MSLSPPFTVNLKDHISLRLYQDTRPHCLEIAQLQKGLVLMHDGIELVEEGAGFGTPVVQYEDKTYFSLSAESQMTVEENHPALIKSYTMNAVSRKKIGKAFYVNEKFYSFFHGFFHKTYVGHKDLTGLFNKIMELRRLLRVDTDFLKAEPRGVVKIRYVCLNGKIDVEVSLSELNKVGCRGILILNEQGASFFRKYSDSAGSRLTDEKIGAWETVQAEEASLANEKETLFFTLRSVKGVPLFRGREKTRGRFSWAGLGYSLPPSLCVFRYVIRLTTKE